MTENKLFAVVFAVLLLLFGGALVYSDYPKYVGLYGYGAAAGIATHYIYSKTMRGAGK